MADISKRLDNFVSGHWTIVTTIAVIIAVAFIHFGYSYLSTGMLQGEEGVQYINMKRFWHDPNLILGNWAKTGWKLIYIFPALFGYKFVIFFNSLVSSLSAYFAFRLSKLQEAKAPALAIVILLSQFLWIECGFRNNSEQITALILIMAVFYHYRESWIVSSLLMSYTVIIRQEMLPIAGLYFLFLCYRRRWIPALLIAVFPLLVNVWGWASTGDPLHFFQGMIESSQSFIDKYPRQGFWHYFIISYPIWGLFTVLGVLLYLVLVINRKLSWHIFILAPVIIYFGIHTAFQWQAVKIGTSTGGNWRYMLVISPLLATLATIGWDKIRRLKSKKIAIPSVVLFLLPALLLTGYTHNYVKFTATRDWALPVMAIIVSALPFLRLKRIYQFGLFALLTLVFSIYYLKPIQLQGEDKLVNEIAKWTYDQRFEDRPIYCANAMLYYFMDRTPEEYKGGWQTLSEETIKNAPKGSIIYWENHYAYGYNKMQFEYMQERPDEFRLLRQDKSDDDRFFILIYEKIM